MCEEIGASPSLPGTEAPRGGLECSLSLLKVALTFKSLRPQPTPRFLLAPHPHPPISLSLFCPQLS